MSAAASTERSRQCRERRQLGLVQFKIEVAIEPLRDMLRAHGRIGDWDLEDTEAIRDALELFLADFIAGNV
jgi:hypothetical protein